MPLFRTRVATKSLYQDATPHCKHDILALNWSNPEKQNYHLLKMVVYFLSARGMIKRVIHLFLLNLSFIPPQFFFIQKIILICIVTQKLNQNFLWDF